MNAPPPIAPESVLMHVLLALAVVIAVSRLLGAAFRQIGQPPVIGEVIAGILLGPSLFGRLAPTAQAWILPSQIAPHLGVVSQIGVVLFMFLVGLELDTKIIRERRGAAVAISYASILLPLVSGAGLAWYLYPRLSTPTTPFLHFALFIAVSMSVTAFPVLARILTDRKLQRTQLGALALAAAAVGDATAWCMLAAIVGIIRQRSGHAGLTVALTVLYIIVMLVVVRPIVARFVRRTEVLGRLSQHAIGLVLIALLGSALATEAIGIHALFGAFLLGAIITHESLVAKEIGRRLEDLVIVLLLPAFFAFTGMRTEIGLLASASDWLYCALIIGVASFGKLIGSTIAARLTGLGWRDASALGALMNTRGLMELIVLNVGLDLGVITPRLFAMLVVMAIVTTLATAPVLSLLERARAKAPADLQPALKAPDGL